MNLQGERSLSNELHIQLCPATVPAFPDYLNKSLFKGDNVSQRWCLVVEDFRLNCVWNFFIKTFYFSCFTYIVKFSLKFKNRKIHRLIPGSSVYIRIVFFHLSLK